MKYLRWLKWIGVILMAVSSIDCLIHRIIIGRYAFWQEVSEDLENGLEVLAVASDGHVETVETAFMLSTYALAQPAILVIGSYDLIVHAGEWRNHD